MNKSVILRRVPGAIFKPKTKIKGAFDGCRFCGGNGCLGCKKELERFQEKNSPKEDE